MHSLIAQHKLGNESAHPITARHATTLSIAHFTPAAASAPVTSAKTLLDHSPTNKNMKIRLETTHSDPKYSHSVEITVDHDNHNILEVWEELIVPALLGYGFQQSSIDQVNQP